MTVLAAARMCRGDGSAMQPGWVRVDGGAIAEVGDGAPPSGARDLGDAVLAPGFVDLQVNGTGDVDFATASVDQCAGALDALASTGCTSCLPTIVSAPLDSYDAMLGRVRELRDRADAHLRTAVLGVHLEGPFLGGAPGAHPRELVRPVDEAWLAALCDRFDGLVRLVTLAPEADPGHAAIRLLRARGVTVALGHSTVTYDSARAAADAGAGMVTHLFNGMGALHHRAPGLAGAALDDARLVPSLIADLVHVHRAMLRVAIASRPDAVLVTDAVAVGAGVAQGLEIHEEGCAARLADGTLAGSTLTMDAAVRNVVRIGVPLEQAIRMATANPARAIGVVDRGELVAGARADLVALDPHTLAVRDVWLSSPV